LAAIPHPPVASVFAGYRREQVRHALDGFGALVPAGEKRSILGVIFTSTLFEGRAPPGHVALTALAGGALQPGIARLPAEELAHRVRDDLAALVGAEGEPVFLRQAVWPRAIPQYILGYGAHLDAMTQCERENPGLLIGGSARDGISIPECVRSGASLAQRVS
jgi:protoporphyrinogen/coproporphyrinogen III oxidase